MLERTQKNIGHNPRVSVRIYVYISYNFVTIRLQLLKRDQGNSSTTGEKCWRPHIWRCLRVGGICDTMAGNKRHGRLSTGNKKCGPTKWKMPYLWPGLEDSRTEKYDLLFIIDGTKQCGKCVFKTYFLTDLPTDCILLLSFPRGNADGHDLRHSGSLICDSRR